MSFEDSPFLILFAVTYGLWWIVRKRERTGRRPAADREPASSTGTTTGACCRSWLAYCVVDWAVGPADRAEPAAAMLVVPRGHVQPGGARVLQVHAARRDHASTSGRPTARQRWAVPFGISFYAFTGIAYMVDVYRKVHPAERSLLRYALSAVFFPHLVAGPILRPSEFLDQAAARHAADGAGRAAGGGVARRPRVLQEAGAWPTGSARPSTRSSPTSATRHGGRRGPCRMCSCTPCRSTSTSPPTPTWPAGSACCSATAGRRTSTCPTWRRTCADFWRRWHMTLSRFLRDYLYIPLGGNRRGACGRT